MGIVRDLYYARKMSAGLKLPAPTVALLIKRLRLAAAMGGGIEKTVSGTMVHITDALAKAALSVLASIEPIQDLHGYDSPWPAGGGKNLLVPRLPSLTQAGITMTNNGDGSFNFVGTATANTNFRIDQISVGSTSNLRSYTAPFVMSMSSTATVGTLFLGGYKDGTWTTPSCFVNSNTKVTDNIDNAFAYIRFNNGDTVNATFYPQIEYGSTASSWEPYENLCPISGRTGLSVYVGPTQDQQDATTYAIDWTSQAGTVYGGTLDVVTGVLTVDRANIASYNGEVINEPWLSSMDAYVEGATPTTGAQVVYTLATPLTYQLTPQEVQMLLGENYVWSSSGDTVSVTYYAEGNANPLQSLNILLGGNYSNPKTADDVSDKEALEIILGGNK